MLQLSQHMRTLRNKARFRNVLWESLSTKDFIDIGFYDSDGARVYMRISPDVAETIGNKLLDYSANRKVQDELR